MSKKDAIDISAFLVGNYVYLRPPDIEKDVINGRWFSWFNDRQTTRYLGQGVFPHTVQKQIDFVESLKNDNSKIVLCIVDKANNKHIGIVSFSNIDLLNKKANISIVLGEKKYPVAAPLEAMALMTEYGFDRLNLNKIDAGQSVELWMWLNTLELIGYRIEGYIESIMIRDGKICNGVHTGITAERFYALRKQRKGKICTDNILNLLGKRRRENLINDIRNFFSSLYSSTIEVEE